MKKLLITGALFAFFIGTASAQIFDLGIKAGVNLAKINSDLTSESNKLGYQVGAWARLGLGGMYLQPEVYLGSKGNKFLSIVQNNGNEVDAEGSVEFTTLDIPILIGKKFGGDKLALRLNAGPVVSFNIDEKTTFSSAFDQATNFKEYKEQTFGLQLGGGVDIGNLTVDLRYETGLSNISKSDRYKQKTNLYQLSLGFKIL